MNSSNVERFAFQLSELGGRITSKKKYKERAYIDLEQFFLNMTLCMNSDARLARCCEYWIQTFGKYLSAQKIQKRIKKGQDYSPQYLGGLLTIADSRFPRGQFSSLSKYTSNKQEVQMLKVFKNKEIADANWLKFGIIAPQFNQDEKEKNIKPISYILENCPELSYRMKGLTTAIADLKAYLHIHKDASLYRAAKDIDLSYVRAHQIKKDYFLNEII